MNKKKCVKAVRKTMKWFFIVFCLYVATFFFREGRVPKFICDRVISSYAPTNLLVRCGAVTIGFQHGVRVRDLSVCDLGSKRSLTPIASAESIEVSFIMRRIRAVGFVYSCLPDSYYAPGNSEKNARVEAEFPTFLPFELDLVRPDILGVKPARVKAEVKVASHRIDVNRIHLDWPDVDCRMSVDGLCYIDLDKQELYGQVEGLAKQAHIRPLLVTLDVPVSYPYFDGFTEVVGPVPSFCSWKVNLVNNDFDLHLGLKPTLGKYNGVPMKRADGKIHLHNFIRGTNLNYRQTIGPIHGVGPKDQNLDGTVIVEGMDGRNKVDVEAKSALPVADLLKIGGFTGDYVGDDVWGDSECKLQFRFPRAMTNNYELLDGEGHVSIRNGRLMRMKGFKGLIEAMPSIAPAVSWFSDATQATCDYKIEHGVIKVDNACIDSLLFSISMSGTFDAVKNALDFNVMVRFAKSDSLVGKILHPITWPFTKLILEFKLTGTPEEPKWEYISIIDRVVEAVQ